MNQFGQWWLEYTQKHRVFEVPSPVCACYGCDTHQSSYSEEKNRAWHDGINESQTYDRDNQGRGRGRRDRPLQLDLR